MVENKHVFKIITALMAAAVILCLLTIVFSGELTEKLGGTGVTMDYETELFDTDEIITIDIQIDEDDWNEMLSNAMSEEYYACDVTVNGKTFKNVGIRPKGNTSLSAIVSDPDSDFYSLKLEFDHFVKGQTCFDLDKLILNNNYADATCMKEAVIYDMYQYIGADASLYNYAQVSVNGEYSGVYLALEAVEESFMLRNFSTQDGELYKPDSMEMGGDSDSFDKGGFSKGNGNMPNMKKERSSSNDSDTAESGGSSGDGSSSGFPPEGSFNADGSYTSPDKGNASDTDGSSGSSNPGNSNNGSFTSPDKGSSFGADGSSGSPDPDNSNNGSFTPPDKGSASNADNSSGSQDTDTASESGAGSAPSKTGSDSSDNERGSASPGMGGFSMGGGGANLNYTDDDLDSYSTIWDGEITDTGKNDHRRVVNALKNISEGTDLETYLDVDNVLKYMAVHTFSVNMDSLSGSMAHNYYLYESDGQLNIFPWDYNLSFGGMGMGGSDATSMVNDAIDTPFSGTQFFDALLENEEYLEIYHGYLRQLAEEYVNGGRFDEVYNRIRSQIDTISESGPSAFYSNEEYQDAVQILYDTIKLRAESIEGQLDGTIPSTDEGQLQDSSALIDASHIDVKAMGQFDMGGFGGRSEDNSEENASEASEESARSSGGESNDNAGFGQPPGNFDPSSLPEGFDPGNMPGGFSPNNGNMPEGFSSDSGNMPGGFSQDGSTPPDMSNFNPGSMPGNGNIQPPGSAGSSGNQSSEDNQAPSDEQKDQETTDNSSKPTDGNGTQPSFSGFPGQPQNQINMKNVILCVAYLAIMLAALFIVKFIRRRKR